jgi:hypothetical protein
VGCTANSTSGDFLWEEISTGNSVLFVGAGVSSGRFPRWQHLINHLRDEFGITSQASDALDIPQWVVEAHGRAALESRMVEVFRDPSKEPTELQRLLACYPFDIVFTTNFDQLMEQALQAQAHQVNVVIEDSQVGRIRKDDRVTLVKMHGCVSAPDTIVVTRDDYETYAQHHPAIVTYLQSLLATRTFLFVGFSLTDPNFRAIYSTVQHVLGAYRRFAFATMLKRGHNPHLWRYWYRKRLILIPRQDSDAVRVFLNAGLQKVNARVERRTNLYTMLSALEQEGSRVGQAIRQLAEGLPHLAQGVRLQDQSPDFGVSWDDYTAEELRRVYALHNFLTLMARIGLTVPARQRGSGCDWVTRSTHWRSGRWPLKRTSPRGVVGIGRAITCRSTRCSTTPRATWPAATSPWPTAVVVRRVCNSTTGWPLSRRNMTGPRRCCARPSLPHAPKNRR